MDSEIKSNSNLMVKLSLQQKQVGKISYCVHFQKLLIFVSKWFVLELVSSEPNNVVILCLCE